MFIFFYDFFIRDYYLPILFSTKLVRDYIQKTSKLIISNDYLIDSSFKNMTEDL